VEVLPDCRASRDELLEALADADISARRGIMAAHRQPAYRDRDVGDSPLPVTERLTDNTLILPLFHQLTDAEQDHVVETLRAAVAPRDSKRGAA
jgi:dTDP-4-amino-4,6-dideoxygalactose transaminase